VKKKKHEQLAGVVATFVYRAHELLTQFTKESRVVAPRRAKFPRQL
jgi:hypothetical protein